MDDGLVPLMSVEDVVQLFKYVPHFKEIEVYIEEGISSVEEYLLYMRNSRGKGVLIEDMEDGDVVKESKKAGELCFRECHGTTEIGNEGKQGDTSTHASSSKAGSKDDDNCFLVELDDDELLIPTPWSDEGKNKIRARRLSGEYEFRNLMFELDFLINYDEIKEKRSKETEASKKEGVEDVNQTVDSEKEKVSQEDVRKGMGEPGLEHVLEGELEVQGE